MEITDYRIRYARNINALALALILIAWVCMHCAGELSMRWTHAMSTVRFKSSDDPRGLDVLKRPGWGCFTAFYRCMFNEGNTRNINLIGAFQIV